MTEHVLVKGVEAHQLPMEPSHDVGILNLIMTAWKQLTPDEVDTVYMYYQEFAPWEFWALVLLFIYSYSHFAGHLFTAPSKLKFPMYFQKVYSTSTGNILVSLATMIIYCTYCICRCFSSSRLCVHGTRMINDQHWESECVCSLIWWSQDSQHLTRPSLAFDKMCSTSGAHGRSPCVLQRGPMWPLAVLCQWRSWGHRCGTKSKTCTTSASRRHEVARKKTLMVSLSTLCIKSLYVHELANEISLTDDMLNYAVTEHMLYTCSTLKRGMYHL